MLKGILIKIRSILNILQTFIRDGDSILWGLAKKDQIQECISVNFVKYFGEVLLWSTNYVLVNQT